MDASTQRTAKIPTAKSNSPYQRAQTSDGTKHVLPTLEQNSSLLKRPLPEAIQTVDIAAIIVAVARAHLHLERSPASGRRSKRSQPQNDEERLKGEHCNDVVGFVPGGDVLSEEEVEDDDPGEDRLDGVY